jgi:hypothetical protein
MFNNKLPVGQSLIKRGWKGDGNCYVCCVGESVDHIFFHCILAKMFWDIFKDVFDLETVPKSLKELSEVWLHGKGALAYSVDNVFICRAFLDPLDYQE